MEKARSVDNRVWTQVDDKEATGSDRLQFRLLFQIAIRMVTAESQIELVQSDSNTPLGRWPAWQERASRAR